MSDKKDIKIADAFKDGKAAATFTKKALMTAPGKTSKISVGRGYTSVNLEQSFNSYWI